MLRHRSLQRVLVLLTVTFTALAIGAVAWGARIPEGAERGVDHDGPAPVALTGFDTDTLLFNGAHPGTWFTTMRRDAASWVRIPAAWNAIAPASPRAGFQAQNPADPQYSFGYLDDAVRRAAAAHLNILLYVDQAPGWATGAGAPRSATPGTWRPNVRDYADFAHALAVRYGGRFPDPMGHGRTLPGVHRFQAWNEPNLADHLAPQWTRVRGRLTPASPTIYRGLLNAFYRAVIAVQPRAYILAAGLAPYGDPRGGRRMHPIDFFERLTCLAPRSLRALRCPDPPRATAFDIHPYGLDPMRSAVDPSDVSVPDVGRLQRVLEAAEEHRHVLPAGEKILWATEIGYPSSPPRRHGPSLATQARYLSVAMWQLWREGVSHVMWYVIQDPPTSRSEFSGAGLFTRSGAAKPATQAFRFPFVAVRRADGTVTLWGRAPGRGPVTIERATAHGWRRLFSTSTTGGGVFSLVRRLPAGLTLRARNARATSLPFATG